MNILLLEDNCTELQILYNILKNTGRNFIIPVVKIIMMLKNPFYQFSMIFLFLTYSSSASDAFNGITFARYIRSLPAYRTTPVLLAPAPLILSKNVLMKSTATITLKSPIMKLYWFMP